jgi:nucleoside-diphosphate-sugar epimerase
MSLHVIVGASGVGVATARLLAAGGDQVKIVTRSGAGPDHSAIERIAADATDAGRLSAIAEGAVALYNRANPRYDHCWPPLASALLAAAERTGAVLASAPTLYGYGPVTGPMSETTPLAATHPKMRLRAQMWRDALAAHQAGRIRATEVRASDFIQGTGLFGLTVAKPVLAGKRALLAVPPDQPHSFTSANDAAAALITAAGDQRAWGKAWHAPTNPPLTLRQLATRYGELASRTAPSTQARSSSSPCPSTRPQKATKPWTNAAPSRPCYACNAHQPKSAIHLKSGQISDHERRCPAHVVTW